jgi:L-ribulokinase
MAKYSIGLDFGTNSCRALIVNIKNGQELASHVFDYPSGDAGVIIDPKDPNLARQNPADYLKGIEVTITESLKKAKQNDPDFRQENVTGIGIDTTGSSPMPVDVEGMPLCFNDTFKNVPAAMVWLWKDHTSFAEAKLITESAAEHRPEYLAKIGGAYSSEWYWSKLLHCKEENPEVFDSVYSLVEICDSSSSYGQYQT